MCAIKWYDSLFAATGNWFCFYLKIYRGNKSPSIATPLVNEPYLLGIKKEKEWLVSELFWDVWSAHLFAGWTQPPCTWNSQIILISQPLPTARMVGNEHRSHPHQVTTNQWVSNK